jgi:hypothetical protein
MKIKNISKQDHIKLLQQAVINGDGGMEFLLDMRDKMQKQIDLLEERISKTHCSQATQFRDIDKLELEFCLINARLFDGKER